MVSLCRFARDRRGTIAIVSAVAFSVACFLSAFAIDLGSLYVQRRHAQGAADLAAIAAANDLDDAYAAARATLRSNGIEDIEQLVVEVGRYEPDAAIEVGLRFTPGEVPSNAVRVSLAEPSQLHFASTFTDIRPEIEVEAIAATGSVASFSLGSRLLALRGGLANAVLGALLGTELELSVMDYEALASADIDAFQFLDALATEIDMEAGTYDDVLQSEVTVADMLAAASHVASDGGSTVAARILGGVTRSVAGASLQPGSIIDAGPMSTLNVGDPAVDGFDASLSALEMLQAAAVVAGGGRQVALDLAGGVPGVLSLTAELTIGEAMQHSGWVSVGRPEAELHTAQTRLRVTAEIGGTGLLRGISIRVPLYVELASASARLAAIECSVPDQPTVQVAAQPGLAKLAIGRIDGDLDDLGEVSVEHAALISTPLLSVTGKAELAIENLDAEVVAFDQSEIDDRTVKSVGTRNALQSAIATLLGRLDLRVEAGGLRLGLTPVSTELVSQQLQAVAAPLDEVVSSLLEALGVRLGEADVRVNGASCRPGVLTG
jgi:uncharacterized membrane protein